MHGLFLESTHIICTFIDLMTRETLSKGPPQAMDGKGAAEAFWASPANPYPHVVGFVCLNCLQSKPTQPLLLTYYGKFI